MKKLFPVLLLLIGAGASAEWVKITGTADTSFEKFIDLKAVRQTGPMNTMRRVWELSNLAKVAPTKVLSIKNYMEYDCKDKRVRVLEESNFSEYWAQGAALSVAGDITTPGTWHDIVKGSVGEIIFKRVCPSDESDTSNN